MGCIKHVFIWQSVLMVANMSLLIKDSHILFNHMDVYHSCMLRHSYFASPDYLVVKGQIRITVIFPYVLF